MIIYIYGLVDPFDSRTRYVGKTNNLEMRLSQHLRYELKGETRREKWIKKLQRLGSNPTIEVIEECAEENWQEREVYWIHALNNAGCDLTNLAPGGIGGSGRTGQTWKKTPAQVEAMKVLMKGKKFPTQTREHRVKAAQTFRLTCIIKTILGVNKNKVTLTDEQRQAISDRMKKYCAEVLPFKPRAKWKPRSPESIAKTKRLKAESWLAKKTSGYVSPQKGKIVTVETRNKLSKIVSDHMNKPGVRLRLSESAKRRWRNTVDRSWSPARRQSAINRKNAGIVSPCKGRKLTPEHRKKVSDGVRRNLIEHGSRKHTEETKAKMSKIQLEISAAKKSAKSSLPSKTETQGALL